MKLEDIKNNQIVRIEIELQDGSWERLSSRIERMSKEHLVIAVPHKNGIRVPLRPGLEVRLIFTTQSGMFGSVVRILGRQLEPFPGLTTSLPRVFSSVAQRREHVRLETAQPLLYGALSSDGDKELQPGTTVDLSGGGVFFISKFSSELGQILVINLPLGGEYVRCQGRVVRCAIEGAGGKSYGIGVKFIDMNEQNREKIVRFIFSKQREWMKKGLL